MRHLRHALSVVATFLAISLTPLPAAAQEAGGDDTTKLEAVQVVGTRIKRAGLEGQTPVMTISAKDIEASGLHSIGDILQRLSVSSSALNTRFNSAGNFGFPADSGGVGSGSTTVSLRNLGAKRTLVLVDGMRWINESSASGVNAAVDLNTIPASAVERIEILTDGASSLYGSDAIAGVVNIVTKKKQNGGTLGVYAGDHSLGDGYTQSANVSFGSSGSGHDFFVDVSHFDQHRISSSEHELSSFPVPGTGVALGSSAIPTTRSVFFPENNDTHGGLCPLIDSDGDGVDDTAFCNITANGTTPNPNGRQDFPGNFHPFTGADRFNFAPFNLLLTPQERNSIFSQGRIKIATGVDGYIRGLYQTRKSVNQAAPEPIFLGPGAGTGGLADFVSIDESNPYNPFGQTLDAGSNLIFVARRPLEGGPRVFTQDVDTRYMAMGLLGDFYLADRTFSWDANFVNAQNRAEQTVTGTYNVRHIANAVGPVDAEGRCVQDSFNCVPLNFFGGPGTITPEMLEYIAFTENDRSNQDLNIVSANVSGSIARMPAGWLDFATGLEYRRLAGSYSPDSVVTSGETNGVPSLPTAGAYHVTEGYVELRVPVLADMVAAKKLEVSLATRYSDYSTFGGTTNSKFGFVWQPFEDLIARATYAEGFRAPSVGELFGSPARFDATIVDPCSIARDGDGNALPAPGNEANCRAQGVDNYGNFEQANTQISIRTGGNADLQPEEARSTTAGVVYSPSWAENQVWASRLDFELTFFNHELTDQIQARDAQTQLDNCVATNDPVFCTGITRGTSGDINFFQNQLLNLGDLDTRGFDIGMQWASPGLPFGRFAANWQTTYVWDFTVVAKDSGQEEPRKVGVEVNDSGIPRWRSMLRLSWASAMVDVGWTLRYLSSLTEACGDAVDFPSCSDPASGTNHLNATVYNDLRAAVRLPKNVSLAAGVNNLLDQDPPTCVSCSLNGYDASNYDLPGRFAYVEATLKF
jgi:iron complex outermembrane recepter protein